MSRSRKDIIAANEISEIRTYTLGGYEQKVLIEGRSASSPIVLFLHGGPGFPLPFSAGGRGLFPEITDTYVAVFWDQLGCGINNRPLDDTFTIDHFVGMSIDLVRALKEDFPQNQINLVGISWGSILAAKTAEAMPDSIDHVLISGQVVKNLLVNTEVYDALLASSLPPKKKEELKRIFQQDTHTVKEIEPISHWIRKYTQGSQVKEDGGASMGSLLWGFLSSPDYTLANFLALFVNGYAKNNSLSEGLFEADLTKTLTAMSVPYLIVQGSCDLITPTAMVSELVATAQNENLRLRVVENSGHMPGGRAMNIILEEAQALFLS